MQFRVIVCKDIHALIHLTESKLVQPSPFDLSCTLCGICCSEHTLYIHSLFHFIEVTVIILVEFAVGIVAIVFGFALRNTYPVCWTCVTGLGLCVYLIYFFLQLLLVFFIGVLYILAILVIFLLETVAKWK